MVSARRTPSSSAAVLALALLFLLPSCRSTRTSLAEIGARDQGDVEERLQDYRIKPGDVLKIEVSTLEQRDFDQAEVKVRADGRADIFFLPNHVLAGKTVGEVRADFADRLRAQVHDAEVSIQVTPSGEKVYLVGQFERPGPFELAPKMTLAEAISLAGGTLVTAHTSGASLRRPYRDPQHPEDFVIDLEDDGQLYLLPGDQVVLGRTWPAQVIYYIKEYILFFLDFRVVYGIDEP
jgi:protein involved in polysaccharide export with SLBB domain